MNRAERRRQKKQAILTARRDKTPTIDPQLQHMFDLAWTHYRSNHVEKAANVYQKILDIDPKQPIALNMLGVIAHDSGEDETASNLIAQAVAIKPDFAAAHSNLGLAFQGLGKLKEAATSYKTSLGIKFDTAETHLNLGNALRDLGKLGDAVSAYKQALSLNSELAEAHHALGVTLNEMGKLEEAESSFQNAILIKPIYPQVFGSYGLLLIALNQWDRAMDSFRKALDLVRGENPLNPNLDSFTTITKTKLRHDIEQFRYLNKIGIGSGKMGELASIYSSLEDEIEWPTSDTIPVALTKPQQNLIKETYNRPFHVVETLAETGSVLSPDLSAAAVTEDYFANAPGMTYVDTFLKPKPLRALRQFLTQSTIWYDSRYSNGYLGASLREGMACPLLFQISEELRKTFPGIFKHHLLQQAWAYKYDSQLGGISTHADFAAVNVNFWITPDSANLSPERGGLVVYKKEAPLNWAFTDYNQNQNKIRKFLGTPKNEAFVVPYAENRVVIFNSDLFHETDSFDFKSGYLNRRINITLLFGNRWE